MQVGDVPDRAPDTRKILDLLIKLEPQARRAGGYVHAPDRQPRSHEHGRRPALYHAGRVRRLRRPRLATPARRLLRRVVAALKAHPPEGGDPTFDAAYRAQFDADHPAWLGRAPDRLVAAGYLWRLGC
ncbi:MAG: hypothetical protein WDM85_10195 [Caulobacteraceae bacterium]